jgi:hypothetical protein
LCGGFAAASASGGLAQSSYFLDQVEELGTLLAHQGVTELIAETSDVGSEGLVRGRCHPDRVFPG